MDALVLRLDAPMMSFGGVMVDHRNVTDRFPGLSMFAGLLANSIGWSHADREKIGALQDCLLIASRWDIAPERIVDYHTVDLGQPKMCEPGWTTRGIPEHRKGGDAKKGTHIRYRHYLANGILTASIGLSTDEVITLDELESALKSPARPLFFGRKTCLPSGPMLVGRFSGTDVLDILKKVPRVSCLIRPQKTPMSARWPAEFGNPREDQIKPVYERRDWLNQWHTGSRMVAEGCIEEVVSCT